MVAFVVHLLPAGRASAGILEGVSEALAAEDVATLCRHNDTSVLHDLEDRESSSLHMCLSEKQQTLGIPLAPPPQVQDEGLQN